MSPRPKPANDSQVVDASAARDWLIKQARFRARGIGSSERERALAAIAILVTAAKSIAVADDLLQQFTQYAAQACGALVMPIEPPPATTAGRAEGFASAAGDPSNPSPTQEETNGR